MLSICYFFSCYYSIFPLHPSLVFTWLFFFFFYGVPFLFHSHFFCCENFKSSFLAGYPKGLQLDSSTYYNLFCIYTTLTSIAYRNFALIQLLPSPCMYTQISFLHIDFKVNWFVAVIKFTKYIHSNI